MKQYIKHFKELSNKEVYHIFQARAEVFIMEQKVLYNDFDNLDLDAFHVWLEDKDGIVAYCRILKPGVAAPEITISRVLTMDRVRRNGIGKKIMQLAINIIQKQLGEEKIHVAAQYYVKEFYEDLGFIQSSDEFYEVGIKHIDMILDSQED